MTLTPIPLWSPLLASSSLALHFALLATLLH